MRLINHEHLDRPYLEQVPGDASPGSYAILSHTWGDHEVSLQDFDSLYPEPRPGVSPPPAPPQGEGLKKILRTCELASHRGIQKSWVDTCCIDKTSSAELSEAINSMFRWYQNSQVCFAFLSDIELGLSATPLELRQRLAESKYFSRGWTLQELIAAPEVKFYDRNMIEVASKLRHADMLASITGIDASILRMKKTAMAGLKAICAAQKMSWAAGRQTTRVEDRAYCLLGIFDINMPMLYGEGDKAFIRLQEEILSKTSDLSLLAWKAGRGSDPVRGVLATSPSDFQDSAGIFLCEQFYRHNEACSVTSRGLRISEVFVFDAPDSETDLILDLECKDGDSDVGIFLRNIDGQFARTRPCELVRGNFPPQSQELYLGDDRGRTNLCAAWSDSHIYLAPQVSEAEFSTRHRDAHFCSVRIEVDPDSSSDYGVFVTEATPRRLWDLRQRAFHWPAVNNGAPNLTASFTFRIAPASLFGMSRPSVGIVENFPSVPGQHNVLHLVEWMITFIVWGVQFGTGTGFGASCAILSSERESAWMIAQNAIKHETSMTPRQLNHLAMQTGDGHLQYIMVGGKRIAVSARIRDKRADEKALVLDICVKESAASWHSEDSRGPQDPMYP